MNDDQDPLPPAELRKLIRDQREHIEELERQLDYFKKRFIAAKQAVQWLENRLRWKPRDSYGS